MTPVGKDLGLKSILDRNIDEHKAEMRQMATRVKSPLLPAQSDGVAKWKSTGKSSQNKKLSPSLTANERADFSERMFLFALGPHAVLDKAASSSSLAAPLRRPIQLKSLDSHCRVSELQYDTRGDCDGDDNDGAQPAMSRSSEKFAFESPRYASRGDNSSQSDARLNRSDILPHYVHPRYRTRYDEMRRFRDENVREGDRTETRLLHGDHLVRHLTDRLQSKLEELGKLGRTPNFHRLRVYSSIFDDLISESWMFKTLFSQIKHSYDAEVDRVLQMPVSEKKLLNSEMDELRKSIYQKEKLENIQSEILQLKEAIKTASETETGYELLLVEEEKKMEDLIKTKSRMDDEKRKLFVPQTINSLPTETEKLELLKTQCWERMDEISQLQKETKYSMSSRATITHLTEGLQDVSIEVEKLNYQKNQLELEVDKMKTELLNHLGNSDIAEKDYKLINSLLEGSTDLPCNLYDESNKWSWYIS